MSEPRVMSEHGREYDVAMEALHAATGDSYAWDIAWVPDSMQPKLLHAFRILGRAIAARDARIAELTEALLDAHEVVERAKAVCLGRSGDDFDTLASGIKTYTECIGRAQCMYGGDHDFCGGGWCINCGALEPAERIRGEGR